MERIVVQMWINELNVACWSNVAEKEDREQPKTVFSSVSKKSATIFEGGSSFNMSETSFDDIVTTMKLPESVIKLHQKAEWI